MKERERERGRERKVIAASLARSMMMRRERGRCYVEYIVYKVGLRECKFGI